MPTELAKAYDASQVEPHLYRNWLERGYFKADFKSSKPSYSIVIPPPNVTGILTMGHVLNNTIQDIFARKARMEGHEVLWLPGTDHAGIATQTVVEKKIKKELGKTRHDLGRDAFLQEIRQWKEKHGGIIIEQLKRLGCSCDWSRERFTMDEDYSRQVAEAFVTLYKRGYIYKGKRMVNWCPVSLTALSDEEVIPTPQKSSLYYVRYLIVGDEESWIEIATTRPETIMADTAIAVHPEDTRYKHLIGKSCWRPLDRAPIPIIADEAIDPTFGTGALKVTPAHDTLDFEIGQRHKLPLIDVLTETGKINCSSLTELHGLDRFEARKKSGELLNELGLLSKEEPHTSNVGFSERAQVPVEPRLSVQWFLKYPKAKEALEAVQQHLIRFYPERWTKVYEHWMENLQDWCISRQLWWGHRIPVWYKGGEMLCQIDSPGKDWEQDPDVLDTWFSAWLWPFATMDENLRAKFYPTNILVTGPDIIFFWVARMIMAGFEFEPSKTHDAQKNKPFHEVYFTGIIRDKQGRKMSKSLGNSPDPLDLIAQYGADGLRLGLMRIAPQGQDIRFDAKQIEEGRNFCNKLWNACRFRLMHGLVDPKANPNKHTLSAFSYAILKELHELIDKTNHAFAERELSSAANLLYDFTWQKFCSEFLEAAKVDLSDSSSSTRTGTLATFDFTLAHILKLLHPFIPFITEELWISLGLNTPDSPTLQFEKWPNQLNLKIDHAAAKRARDLYEAAEDIRRLKAEFNLQASQKPKLLFIQKEALEPNEIRALTELASTGPIEMIGTQQASPSQLPERAPMILTSLGEFYMPLEGLIDFEKERQRLQKELEKVQADLERENKKLQNPEMLKNAPMEKVEEWRRIAAESEERLTRLNAQLEQI